MERGADGTSRGSNSVIYMSLRKRHLSTLPNSWRFIFCDPKMREYRVMSGVAVETKLSGFIPRFFSYHAVALGIDFTVRTRWSRDLIVAAGVVIFLRCTWTSPCLKMKLDALENKDGECRVIIIGDWLLRIGHF